MPIYDQQSRLLQKLHKKTTSQESDWTKTDVPDQYCLKLRQGSILLDRYVIDDDKPPYYTLTVTNSAGERVDEFSVYRREPHWEVAADLFTAVSRQVNGAEYTIDAMLEELNS